MIDELSANVTFYTKMPDQVVSASWMLIFAGFLGNLQNKLGWEFAHNITVHFKGHSL